MHHLRMHNDSISNFVLFTHHKPLHLNKTLTWNDSGLPDASILNLQELWVSKQELQEAKQQIRELEDRLSATPAVPETSQEGDAEQEERSR